MREMSRRQMSKFSAKSSPELRTHSPADRRKRHYRDVRVAQDLLTTELKTNLR